MNFIEKNMPFKTVILNNFDKKLIKKNIQFFKQFRLIAFKTGIAITVFFIYFTSLSHAAELPPIGDITSNLQQTYEKTIDFKADFIQETTVKSLKRTDVEEGVVFFKNPRNMLWNYTKPKAKKMVINSKKVWLYLPQEKVVYTQDSDRIFQSQVLIKFLSGLGKLKDDFTIEYAKSNALDKNGNYRLVLTPLEKSASYNTLQILVDKSIFYILQVNFDDTFGNSTALRFSNISMNTGLAPNIFQFQPPAGVSIFKMP
jgi:outer membrane lipoprotein carrier protein